MDSLFPRAYEAHHNGQLAEAERGYRKILSANPAHVDALHMLGLLHHQQGKPGEAIQWVRRAAALQPTNAILQLNLGNVHKALGQFDHAIEHFRNALTLAPELSAAHYNLGNAYVAVGRHEDASIAFTQALRLNPDDSPTYNNLGNALNALGRHQEAIEAFHQALRTRPWHAGTHNNLGIALNALGRSDEALAHFQVAITTEPRFAVAHVNLGNTLDAVGKHAQAASAFEAALALHPQFPAALFGLGNALAAQGLHAEAIVRFELAVGFDPAFSLAWLNLGCAHHALGAYEAALKAFEHALRQRPDLASAHVNRALTLLTLRDFTRGLPEYEWRFRANAAAAPAPTLPRWQGEPIRHLTLWIQAEQGFGDTLQFIRFVPQARARAKHVVLEVQPELLPLLAPLAAQWQITLIAKGAKPPPADQYCPLLSLPLALGITFETLPAFSLCLKTPKEYRRRWRGSLGSHAKCKMGIAWSGRVQAREDRAVPLTALAPLFALEDIDWIVLQPELSETEIGALQEYRRASSPTSSISWFNQRIENFADTAAIIEQLSGVVSIDTSIAHLAGMLDKPLWIMLPFSPDWRWFTESAQTPWYPNARLVRQSAPGQWDEVVEKIARTLDRALASS